MVWNKIKKHILPFLLCVAVIMCFVIPPVTVKADAIILTIAITEVIIAVLISVGIEPDNGEDWYSLVQYVWNELPYDTQVMFAELADSVQVNTINDPIVNIASTSWDIISTLIHTIFGSPEQIVEYINPIQILLGNYDSYSSVSDLTPTIGIISKGSSYNVKISNVDYSLYQTSTYTEIKIDFGDFYLTKRITSTNNIQTDYTDIKFTVPYYNPNDENYFSFPSAYAVNSADVFVRWIDSSTYYYHDNNYSGVAMRVTNDSVQINTSGSIWQNIWTAPDDWNGYPYTFGEYLYDMTLSHNILIPSVNLDYYPGTGLYTPGNVTTDGPDVTLKVPVAGTLAELWEMIQAWAASNVIVTEYTQTIPYNPYSSNTNVNKFRAPGTILTKFPFCIPFDLYDSIAMMKAEPVSPYFEIPFVVESLDFEYDIIVDFTELGFDNIAVTIRWFFGAIFTIGLILVTRNIIKG